MSIFDLLKRRKKEEEFGVVPDNGDTITSSAFGKQGNFKNESPETQSEDVKFGMPEIETKMEEDSNFGDFNSPSSTTMGNIMGKTGYNDSSVFNNVVSKFPEMSTVRERQSSNPTLGLPGTDGVPLTLETLRPFYKKHRSAFEGYPGPNDDATDAKFEGRPVISDTLRNYVDDLMSEGWKKIDEDNVRNIDILVDFYERNWGSKSQNGGQGSADIFSQMHSTEQPKTMTEPELNTNDKVYTPYQKDGKTQLPNIRVNDPDGKLLQGMVEKNEIASFENNPKHVESNEGVFFKPYERRVNKNGNKNDHAAWLLMDIALTTPDKLKNTNEYVVASESEMEKLKNKNISFENKDKTLVFNPNGSIADAIKTSKDMQNYVKKWYAGEKLDNKVKPDTFSVTLSDNPNILKSIHGGTVRNFRDNGDGTVSFDFTDRYDFKLQKIDKDKVMQEINEYFDVDSRSINDRYKNRKQDINKALSNPLEVSPELTTNITNNMAEILQKLRHIRNYNIVIPVTMKKEELGL